MTLAAPSPDGAPAGARGRSGRRGLLLAAKWVAAVLSLMVLVGSGYAWATYNNFTDNVQIGGTVDGVNDANTPDIDGVAQNILLVGNDTRVGATPEELREIGTEDDDGGSNTDTMIVLHVPADGSTATLISFPRDSYVNIPGYGSARLNAAYGIAYQAALDQGRSETAAEGAGMQLTAKTIAQLTGLTIDHYLQIKLIGFYRISNAIGGVDVCLKNAVQDRYSGIDLPAGVTKGLKGTQAVAFVRQRHGLTNGDIDRVNRQRYFLGAVFRKVSSAGILLNPIRLQNLLDAVSSSLLQDQDLDLLKLAGQMQGLASGNIIGATMVFTGYENIDGQDVLGVDPAAVKAQMKVLVGAADPTPSPSPTPSTSAPSTVAPGDVTVQVLNGSGVGGAAAAASARLGELGMNVLGTGDADPLDTTTITYPPGMEAQANTVAATVPGATVTADPAATEVTLTLGADGLTPAGGTTSSTAPSVPASATGSPAVDNASGGLACID